MSTSLIDASQKLSTYGSVTVFIFGVVGGTLNLLVFLTLRTFRQSSSAFYLIIMTISNFGQLFIGLFTRYGIYLFQNDFATNSLFYCKFRLYFSQICAMISITCFCLATIDQFCGTSKHPKLRQICRIKTAAILVIFFGIFWILHGIPFAILFYHSQSSSTDLVQCIMTNFIYLQYRSYFYFIILNGILPLSIIIIFGTMAYRNIHQILHYTVPLVRQELDRQITKMILTQAIISIFTILPYTIANIVAKNLQTNDNILVQAQIDLTSSVTFLIYYIYFASPFYIYVCTSERFRRQLIYVLFNVYCKSCKRRTQILNNQITPSV